MKKFLSLCIFVSFVLSSVFSAEPTLEQKQAVCMMNYAQYVTYKLKTYNNILALEDEYANLKDNMALGNIKDRDSVELINSLMDKLYEEQKRHTNRERLELAIEKQMNAALFKSAAQAVSGMASGGLTNPFSLAVNAAMATGGAFIGYQQFKDQISAEYDEKMFEFETQLNDALNESYKDLNTYTWDLLHKYGISDDWRLNETELERMFTWLKDSNVKRAYENLKSMSSTGRFVMHFPMYWYHLAKLAFDAGDENSALEYYRHFEEVNVNIFRYDAVAVDAYKGKIAILAKDLRKNQNEIKQKLEFIEQNASSWKDIYFCALVYAQLGNTFNARRLLKENINQLSSVIENQFLEGSHLSSLLKEPEKKKVKKASLATVGSSEYSGLELSRKLLSKIGDEKASEESIVNQYKNDTQSMNEVLFQFGLNPSSLIIGISEDDIGLVRTTVVAGKKTCRVEVKIPLNWVLSSNTELYAFFEKDGQICSSVPLKLDEKKLKNMKKISSKPRDVELFYTSGNFDLNWEIQGWTFGGILLDHPLYPLRFMYYSSDSNGVPKGKDVNPCAIEFNNRRYDLFYNKRYKEMKEAFREFSESINRHGVQQ